MVVMTVIYWLLYTPTGSAVPAVEFIDLLRCKHCHRKKIPQIAFLLIYCPLVNGHARAHVCLLACVYVLCASVCVCVLADVCMRLCACACVRGGFCLLANLGVIY